MSEDSPTNWIDEAIGRRYAGCTFGNFEATTDQQRTAVDTCSQYVRNFKDHLESGRSLCIIGPKGTGKDHLMVAVIKAMCEGYRLPAGRCVYRDGLRLFAEFRSAFSSSNPDDEDRIVGRYIDPHLLAVSDPVPPIGKLSEYEMRVMHRIVDGRYRECLPMAVTMNVESRKEADERFGPQAADRLFESAVVVKCNWESYRIKQ